MGKSGTSGFKRLIIAIAVLAVLALIAWAVAMNYAQNWTPPREEYPRQGVTVSADSGTISWRALAAQGVGFGYISASSGADGRDANFIKNYTEARAANIGFAPLHHYSLCDAVNDQAQNFVTTVPRDDKALPAAIALDFQENCNKRPPQSLVVSDLITFINQVESHIGKRALLRVSPEFEAAYGISAAIQRDIWVIGDYFAPDYSAKPWVMWTANARYSMDGAERALAWNVIKPKETIAAEIREREANDADEN